jgi:hypothetical protein
MQTDQEEGQFAIGLKLLRLLRDISLAGGVDTYQGRAEIICSNLMTDPFLPVSAPS